MKPEGDTAAIAKVIAQQMGSTRAHAVGNRNHSREVLDIFRSSTHLQWQEFQREIMAAYETTEAAITKLSPEEYRVTQQRETERPGTEALLHNKELSIYVDIVSCEPLFASSDKYEADCGWPSFTKPIKPENVNELRETRHRMIRTEVRSTQGDRHLGHVFPDGPNNRGGLHYCINSVSLHFVPRDKMVEQGYGEYLNQLEDI
jgi:peptide-methionine (R)-S-oxide reductase